MVASTGYQQATRLSASDRTVGFRTHRVRQQSAGGARPRARQRVECAVKVWTEAGESDWSDPLQWEMGLLDPDDWKATWIEPPEDGDLRPGKRPAWHLRHQFVAGKPARTARLYAT